MVIVIFQGIESVDLITSPTINYSYVWLLKKLCNQP